MDEAGIAPEYPPKLRRSVNPSNWQTERQRFHEQTDEKPPPVMRSRHSSHGNVHMHPSERHPHAKKASISERERMRKAGDLVEPQINSFDHQPPVAHRVKSTVSFSERQRRRKRAGNGFFLTENECYDSLDQLFPGARADYAVSDAPPSRGRREPQSLFDSWNSGIRKFLDARTGGHGLHLDGGGDSNGEFASSVAGNLRATNVVPEFPAQSSGSESEKEELEDDGPQKRKVTKFRFRLKLGSNGRRLLSGAIAGAFSRTAVAPLETIRTHLMVGSHGHSVPEVFNWIVANEGWQGLFRGNAINVLRVAPSKAIEVSLHPFS